MRSGARVSRFHWCTEWLNPCFVQPSKDAGTGIAFGQGLGCPSEFDTGYIWVNTQGKRFTNEMDDILHQKTYPLDWFTFHAGYYNDTTDQYYVNLPAFLVFDQDEFDSGRLGRYYAPGGWGWNTGHPEAHRHYEWSEDNMAELEKGYILQADTIEELAAKMTAVDWTGKTVSVDPEGLAQTIADYNDLCDSGEDDPEFGRTADTLLPVATPPFYAIEIAPGNIYSIGGPAVNRECNAVDWDGNPIPRLYFAGNAGSMFALRQGAVHGAITQGRIAATYAVKNEPIA